MPVRKVRTGRNDPVYHKGKFYDPSGRKIPSNASLNRKVKRLQKDQEIHYHEVFQPNTNPNDGNAATVGFCLNLVNEGDTNTTRKGSVIRATSLRFKVRMLGNNTNSSCSSVRIIIFWDRQPNGANPTPVGAPTSTSYLDSSVVTVGYAIHMQCNFNQTARFKTLFDKTYTIPNYIDIAAALNGRFISKKIKLNRLCHYDSTGNGIADLAANSLWVIMFSDQNVGTGLPTVDFTSRFYFKDP